MSEECEKCPVCGAEEVARFRSARTFECLSTIVGGEFHASYDCRERQLAQEHRRLNDCYRELEALRRQLAQRDEQLAALKAKLPKTVDGVTVVPGDVVWVCDDPAAPEDQPRSIRVDALNRHGSVSEWLPGDGTMTYPACYSTREAAQAAAEAEKEAQSAPSEPAD